MALGNLTGVGALQESLATTNALLQRVLDELMDINSRSLAGLASELRLNREAATQTPADPAQ